MFRPFVAMLGISVFLWAAAACGGGGGDETIDLGDGGEVSIGDDLPDSFPDDFPIYDGADLQGAVEGEQDGVTGIVATWTTGDSFDDVKSFYESAFEGGPWVSAGSGSSVGTIYWSLEHSDDDQVGYLALTDGDEVAIAATVGDDPSSATNSDDDEDTGSDGTDPSSSDGSEDEASSDEDADTTSDDDAESASADLPEEVDLSDDYPSDVVALPDDIRVTGSSSISSDGMTTHFISFYSQDSTDDLATFFQNELEGKGFTQSIQTSDNNGIYAVYFENEDGTGTSVSVSVYDASVEGYREVGLQVTGADA